MAYNNTVTLTGNMGSEAKIIETEDKTFFAAFSLATQDSYKDQNDQWQDKELLWHNILVFNPRVVEMVKNLKTGTRLTLTGSLSYRPFKTQVIDSKTGEAKEVTKLEASIVAGKLELSPLVKKKKQETKREDEPA